MDEEIDRLVVSVRADTRAFAGDVADMRGSIEGGLGGSVERAGRLIENSLGRALRTGKLGFEDLKRIALAALSEIAASAISGGIAAIFGGGNGGGGSGGGLLSAANSFLSSALGAPGRATGGPVSPGRAYRVGERGPELFVPTSSGRIETGGGGGGGRDVRVAITLNAPAGTETQALARSGRQVARAVRQALEAAER
jgi:hypothetical protein